MAANVHETLHLTREVKVYLQMGPSSEEKYWEIPVLDGLSFSQGTNVNEVTIAEMVDSSGASRRGRIAFNDSLNPVEWSFATYAAPFNSASSKMSATEEALWALMLGATHSAYTAASASGNAGAWSDVISKSTVSAVIDFNSSNKLEFGDATLHFYFPANSKSGSAGNGAWYKCTSAVVNEASVDFDLDGVTTINWSGFGTLLEDHSNSSTALASSLSSDVVVTEGLDQTGVFIRNRLTELVLDPTGSDVNSGSAFNLVLTGGNITITNNIEYITPSSLGVVNKPLGHVSGTRSVTGNFTCYLNNKEGANVDGSGALFRALQGATTTVQNEFALTFKVGGASNTPRVEFNCPTAMLEIPNHAIDDVVSLEVNFHGLPSSIVEANEMQITYVGPSI